MTLRLSLSLAALALSSLLTAQTPPVRPQTADVKLPPKVVVPGPPTADPDVTATEPLTIDEAVAIALRRQPNIGAAEGDLLSARGRTRQARSATLPQITFDASATEERTFRESGVGGGNSSDRDGLSTSASLSVSQLLTDFGRTRNAIRAQEAFEDASAETLDQVRLDTAGAVRAAFYTMQETLEAERTAEQNVANRQAQLDLANARLDSGLGQPGDLVQAKSALAQAVISLTQARADSERASMETALQMGIDPRTPFTVLPATEPELTGDVNGFVLAALRDRPDLSSARAVVDGLEFSLAVARATNAPSLSLRADLAALGRNDPLRTQTGGIGLNFSWRLGDGGFARGAITEAEGILIAARADLLGLVQVVTDQVVDAYLSLETARLQVETATVQVENAREFLRIAEGRYQGDIGTFLEVVDAQDALYAAEQNLTSARFAVERAKAALRQATGSLTNDFAQ